MNRNPDSSKYGSLGIVLAYTVGAALWILFSDKVVEWLFDDPAKIVLAGTLKGWLFVALTSLLLYGLLRRRTACCGAASIAACLAQKTPSPSDAI